MQMSAEDHRVYARPYLSVNMPRDTHHAGTVDSSPAFGNRPSAVVSQGRLPNSHEDLHTADSGFQTLTNEVSEASDNRTFPCPYRIRFPDMFSDNLQYRSCTNVYTEIHRLRPHLLKHHYRPRCDRCGTPFETDAQVKDHRTGETACKRTTFRDESGGFDADQRDQLKRRKAMAITDEQHWRDIYKILFPSMEDGAVPSPCRTPDFSTIIPDNVLTRKVADPREAKLIAYDEFAASSRSSDWALRATLSDILVSQDDPVRTIDILLDAIAAHQSSTVRPRYLERKLSGSASIAKSTPDSSAQSETEHNEGPSEHQVMHHSPDHPFLDSHELLVDTAGMSWDGDFPPGFVQGTQEILPPGTMDFDAELTGFQALYFPPFAFPDSTGS